METMLLMASDRTLDDLLQAPGLQFLYPAPGLHWVSYKGLGLAKSTVTGKMISFDPTKIQGVRVIKENDNVKEALIKDLDAKGCVKNVRPLTKEEIRKEGNDSMAAELVIETEIIPQKTKSKALEFKL